MTTSGQAPAQPPATVLPEPAARAAARPDPFSAHLRPRQARVGLTATILGGAGALVMLGTLLMGDVLSVVIESMPTAPLSASLVLALPLAALGLFVALAFYGVRLEGVRRAPRPWDAGGDLRVTRGVAGALLMIGLVLLGAGHVGQSPLTVWPVMLAAAAWSAACCWLLLDARRAEWALAAARGVPFTDGPGRGFQVLVPAVAPIAGAPPAEGMAAVLPASAVANEWGHAPPGTAPQPQLAPAAAAEVPGATLRHCEVVLLVVVLLGVAAYLFPAAMFVTRLDRYLSPSFWTSTLGGTRAPPRALVSLVDPVPPWMFNSRGGPAGVKITLVTSAVAGACAVAWVAWGAAVAIAGPRLRRPAIVLAAVMVGLALFSTGHHLYEFHGLQSLREFRSRPTRKPFEIDHSDRQYLQFVQVMMVRNGLAPGVLPLLLLVLLTRPQAHALFDARPRRPRRSTGRA